MGTTLATLRILGKMPALKDSLISTERMGDIMSATDLYTKLGIKFMDEFLFLNDKIVLSTSQGGASKYTNEWRLGVIRLTESKLVGGILRERLGATETKCALNALAILSGHSVVPSGKSNLKELFLLLLGCKMSFMTFYIFRLQNVIYDILHF